MKSSTRGPLVLSAAILVASALFASAYGDECGPLRQFASTKVTLAPNGLPLVPVMLNGSPRNFLFGTASGVSAITQATADSLNLHPVEVPGVFLSINGSAINRAVSVSSFVYGGVEAKDMRFIVSPPNPNNANSVLPVDGFLANDLMERFDTDMDFAAGKISYFLTYHCDGHVVYWTTAPAAAVPFRHSLPGSRNIRDTHIRFHVTLDGKDILALLNTNVARTTLSAKVAEALFDVNYDSPGTILLGDMSDRKMFGHVFKSISFGDVTVTNPHVVIIPDIIGLHDPNNAIRADSRIKKDDDDLEPDMTIGMDVLQKLHIYIASKEGKLYITAADQPAGTQ